MKNARKPLSLILALVMTLSLTAFAPVLAAPDGEGTGGTTTSTDPAPADPATKDNGSSNTDMNQSTPSEGTNNGTDKTAVPAVAAVTAVEATPAPTVKPINPLDTLPENGGSYTILGGKTSNTVLFKPQKTGVYTFTVPRQLQGGIDANNAAVTLTFQDLTVTPQGTSPATALTSLASSAADAASQTKTFFLESGKTYEVKHSVTSNTSTRGVSCNMAIAYPTTGSITLTYSSYQQTYYYNFKADKPSVYTFKALVNGTSTGVGMSLTSNGTTALTLAAAPANFDRNGNIQPIANTNQAYIGQAVYLNKDDIAVVKLTGPSAAGQANVNVTATAAPAASGALTEQTVIGTAAYTTYRIWSPTETGLYIVKISTTKDGRPAPTGYVPKLADTSGAAYVKYFEGDAAETPVELYALADKPGGTQTNTKQYLFYVSKAADYFLQIENIYPGTSSTLTIEKVPAIKDTGSVTVKAPVGEDASNANNFLYDFAYLTFTPGTTGWYTFEADGGELVTLNEADLLGSNSQVAFPNYINIGTVFAPATTWADNLKYQEAAKKMTASGYFEQGKEYIMRYIPRPTDAVKFSTNPGSLTDYSGTVNVKRANFPAIATTGTTIGTTSVPTYGAGADKDSTTGYFTSYFTFTPKANTTSTHIFVTAGLKTGMSGYANVQSIEVYDSTGQAPDPVINKVEPKATTGEVKGTFTGGKTYYIAVQTDAPTTCTVRTEVEIEAKVNNNPPKNEGATVILKDSAGNIIQPEAGDAKTTYKLPYGGSYTVTAGKPGNTPKTVTIIADKTQTVNIDLVATQTISVTLNKDTTGSYCNIAKTSTQTNGTTTTITVDVTAKDLAPKKAGDGCWLDFVVAKPDNNSSIVVGWNEYSNTNAVNPTSGATITTATAPAGMTGVAAYSFEAIPKDGQVKNGWIAVSTTTGSAPKVTSTTVYILRFADNYASGNITVRPAEVAPNDYYYVVADTAYKFGVGKVPDNSSNEVSTLAKGIKLNDAYKYSSPMSAQAASMVGSASARVKYINDAIKLVDQLYANVRPENQYATNDPSLRLGSFAFVKLTNPETGGKEYKYVPWDKVTKIEGKQEKFPTKLATGAAYTTADYFDTVVAVPYMDVEMTSFSSKKEFGFKAAPHAVILVTNRDWLEKDDPISKDISGGNFLTKNGNVITQTNPETNRTWTSSELKTLSQSINAIVVEDREIVSTSSPIGLNAIGADQPTSGSDIYAIQGDTYIYRSSSYSSGSENGLTFTSTHGLKPSDFVITEANKAVASIPSRVEGEIMYTNLKAAIEDAQTDDIIYYLYDTDGRELSVNATVGSDVRNLTIVSLKGAPLTKANIVINGTRVTNGTYRGNGTPVSSWNILMGYTANGSVVANPNPASPGQAVTLTATPNNGYKLSGISATTTNGAALTLTPVSYNSNAYTFIMPADGSRVNVSASFVGGGVTLVQRAGGVLTYSVNGSTVTVTASPSAGYALSSLSVVSSTGAVIYPTAVSANVYTFTLPANGTATVTPNWVTTGAPVTGGVSVIPASGGTVTTSSANPRVGDPVLLTVTPYNGYEMNSVMVRGAGDTPVITKKVSNGTYRFTMPSGGVTVTPTWRVSGSAVPYTDYIPGWAKNYVDYTYTRNLMQGIGTNTFAGANNVDRASMWTILSRMDGHYPKTSGYPWYSEPRDWAVTQVNAGQRLSDGTNPSGNVTREQVATMLYRYAKSMGKDVSKASGLGSFVDGSKVSTWASDAVRWACGTGIIQGKDGSRLDPQGAATRNEIAKMISTFCTTQGL